MFQWLTYNKETPCCRPHDIPVLLIMTSNCDEAAHDTTGYTSLLKGYQNILGNFVGPATVLTCGNTLQVNDCSKYNWTLFDPATNQAHHDETFDDYLAKARELGAAL